MKPLNLNRITKEEARDNLIKALASAYSSELLDEEQILVFVNYEIISIEDYGELISETI